ncbi:hypothetical protein Micbo1qcDRAFT_166579 [Microdochium bolleyi]|uniref:Apple domain-containing protein n=1 Tax=Microdochium bolleyi TaxID=196109 RepID=A0A136IU03_9PEZI|nr:hypothetical protein Micbo1qcDRAFT_166579 [Microdochium bolleyi]
MKATVLLASTALVLAEAVSAATARAAAPSCTAELLGEFCDYPKPPGTGVFNIATDGRAGCWKYCAEHQPCDFSVWVEANAELDKGTCWVYPGQSFDASLGTTEGCGNRYLKVYGKPTCTGLPAPTPIGTATAPVLACAATASPSAVAQVCDYPTPKEGCFSLCSAQTSAAGCLSQCAQLDSCAFVVYNPHNPAGSPHSTGSCWMYPEAETYDPSAGKTCSGPAEQYVYENKCPKPPRPSSSTPAPAGGASPTAGAAAGGSGSGSSGAAGVAGAAATQASPTPTEVGKSAAGSVRASVGSLVLGGVAILMAQLLA